MTGSLQVKQIVEIGYNIYWYLFLLRCEVIDVTIVILRYKNIKKKIFLGQCPTNNNRNTKMLLLVHAVTAEQITMFGVDMDCGLYIGYFLFGYQASEAVDGC